MHSSLVCTSSSLLFGSTSLGQTGHPQQRVLRLVHPHVDDVQQHVGRLSQPLLQDRRRLARPTCAAQIAEQVDFFPRFPAGLSQFHGPLGHVRQRRRDARRLQPLDRPLGRSQIDGKRRAAGPRVHDGYLAVARQLADQPQGDFAGHCPAAFDSAADTASAATCRRPARPPPAPARSRSPTTRHGPGVRCSMTTRARANASVARPNPPLTHRPRR